MPHASIVVKGQRLLYRPLRILWAVAAGAIFFSEGDRLLYPVSVTVKSGVLSHHIMLFWRRLRSVILTAVLPE